MPTLEGFGQSLQSVAASLIAAFNPYAAGSPACPALCDIPECLTTRALVDMLDPDDSNPMIQAWLAGFDGRTRSPEQQRDARTDRLRRSRLLQTGMFNLTPEQLDAALTTTGPAQRGAACAGCQCRISTDPGYLHFISRTTADWTLPSRLTVYTVAATPCRSSTTCSPSTTTRPTGVSCSTSTRWQRCSSRFRRPRPSKVRLRRPKSDRCSTPQASTWARLLGGFDASGFDLSALFGGFDPAELDLGALFGGFDAAAISAEFANLLEDLTAAWLPDLAISALTAF